jgi:hypothetical protein
MHRHLPVVPVVAVFKHIYPLPGTQGRPALLNRDCQLDLCQGCLDVCRHIVGSFSAVPVNAALWCNTSEEIQQVPAHIGIGIFLDGQRCGGVADEQREQAFSDTLVLAPTDHRSCDLIKPGSVCFGTQSVRYLSHPPSSLSGLTDRSEGKSC